MATRQQIIDRAKELIQEHPDWGRNKVNTQLRAEFGKGLRKTEVDRLKTELISPVIREQAIQVRRYQTLRKEGFLHEEAEYYSQFPISKTGMQQVRRFRQSELKRANLHGISKKEQEDYLKESYRARGYVTHKGELKPDAWNTAVYNQLLKPIREREHIVIPAETYELYKEATHKKISKSDSLRLASRIPPNQWNQRLDQYNTLRKAHFSHFEALKIVTTKTKADSMGRRRLQNLDLNKPAWQQMIEDRKGYYIQQIKRFMAKNMTRKQAEVAFYTNLNAHYKGRTGDTRTDKTPWDWLREYYKFKRDHPQSDFITAKEQRDKRFKNEKMPFRAR